MRILLLISVLLIGCSKPKQQLHVFTWQGIIDLQLIGEFEKRFDCKVTVDTYDNPEGMMAKMASGGASIYDLVVPSNTTLPILIQQKLLAPLRNENIPNLRNIDPQFSNPSFDPGNRYGAK